MKSFYTVAAAVLLGALSLATNAGPRVVELTYEAAPSMIRMPESNLGELTLQSCDTCKATRLRANASTRYFLGDDEVSLAEMTQYLARNPNLNMAVMRLKDTSVLSRVVAFVPKSAK
jgi:hypothetical protein